MTTKIYGEGDNLVILEGDIDSLYSNMTVGKPVLLIFDDFTVLDICYTIDGFWKIKIRHRGEGFKSFIEATNLIDKYSDTVIMSGVFKCYLVENWVEFD
jgi:hypothetical protein